MSCIEARYKALPRYSSQSQFSIRHPVVGTDDGSGINLSLLKLAVQHEALGVVIGDLKLGAEAQTFVADNASRVVFAECDVTKRKHFLEEVKKSISTFGDVPDVYIAGAGVFEPVRTQSSI